MAGADYPNSTYYPASSNNYSAADRPSSHPIDKIVVHVTQGSWSGALNWFSNPNAGVSAHYTVRSSDGVIGQSVHEKDIAYHAGNWTYNQTSIGIEHEGYVSDPSWFTDEMYRSSAKLSAYLCDKYRIPIERTHILGHNEVPNATHTDPGQYWDWAKYMDYVKQYSASTAYSQVVDNTTSGRFYASSAWKGSSYSSQRYGKNYRYTTPKAVNDTARYKLKIPSTGDYEVYAWWPATPGYSSSAPIGVSTTSGLKWVRVDQRTNGGKWVSLGTFNMAEGDRYNVRFSRWTGAKGYVVADAIKVVKK